MKHLKHVSYFIVWLIVSVTLLVAVSHIPVIGPIVVRLYGALLCGFGC